MFRNADAFGVDHLYLTGYTGTPPRVEIAKVSLGAEQLVPWSHARNVEEVIVRLKAEGVSILAFESDASFTSLSEHVFDPKQSYAVLVGNEPDGLSAPLMALATDRAYIPMYGQKSSLNVAVASGVALYAIRTRC